MSDTIKLWHEVFSLANGREWVKLPDRLTSQLGLHQGIGICGGILQMQISARGANGLIDRINQNTDKQGA